MKLVYTAFSKRNFYQREIVSAYCLGGGVVPLNPFMNWNYFLGDAVARDLVRTANGEFVLRADEVWQFGAISNGCYDELMLAKENGKNLRYFGLGKTVSDITEFSVDTVQFEKELTGSESEMRRTLGAKASHKPASEFTTLIAQAHELVKVGGRYQHYKNKQFYTVVDLAILEATEEIAVIYQAEYGDRQKWIRPLANFTEKLDGVNRFELVEDEK